MLAIYFLFQRLVNRPIQRLLDLAGKMRRNDLSQSIEMCGHTEISHMSARMNLVNQGLREMRGNFQDRQDDRRDCLPDQPAGVERGRGSRTGRHGRGRLCRGSNEVRSLAMRAAEAARSTSDLISGTVKSVQEGSTLVSQTNAAFAEMGETMLRTAERVSAIAAASKEQALGIEQINKAVAEMDKATQDYAATAEELAASAGQLKLEPDSGTPSATSSHPDGAMRNAAPMTAAAVSEF